VVVARKRFSGIADVLPPHNAHNKRNPTKEMPPSETPSLNPITNPISRYHLAATNNISNQAPQHHTKTSSSQHHHELSSVLLAFYLIYQ